MDKQRESPKARSLRRTGEKKRRKSSYRVIAGLKEAETMHQAPAAFRKSPKLKGCRAKGKTYERTVGRKLANRIKNGLLNFGSDMPTIHSEQWFYFRDMNGSGYCQTDHYLKYENFIVLLECKLTQSNDAIKQMALLYRPVLEHIYGLPVIPVQVCKNLRYNPPNLIVDIEDLLAEPKIQLWTWHYLAER